MSNKKDTIAQSADKSKKKGLMNSITRRRMVISGTTLAGLTAVGVAGMGQSSAAQPSPSKSAERNLVKRFDGKVVLVTGATSGIGRATAIAFAREGARVVFCGRRVNLGQQVEREIKQAGGEALYVKTDMIQPDEVKNLIDVTVKKYGRLDIAFNNAGYEGKVMPFTQQTLENWDTVMNTNARGVFLSMLYEIPQMVKQGGGVIINNASTAGHFGIPVIPAYVASKHAIIGLTKSAALAHPKENVRVNSISPGFVDTAQVDRFFRGDQQKKAQSVRDNVPVGRIGQVEEIANLVMWLSTGDSPFITGTDIVIDGGDMA